MLRKLYGMGLGFFMAIKNLKVFITLGDTRRILTE